LKSTYEQNELNKNKVITAVGPNKVHRDFIELEVYDNSGNKYTVGELFDIILDLKYENKLLKREIKNLKISENNTDELITKTLDLLSLKVTQLEKTIDELTSERGQ
jgi:sporulation protein YlmC with PRC-barrel domain